MKEKGHFRKYVDKKFGAKALDTIDQANSIIQEYESKGYSLTLRQLYYQFVARALVPNTSQSYNNLGSLINDGRMAGMISWTAIEDRTRNLMGLDTFAHPGQALDAARHAYRRDLWATQHMRPEVWVEKEALIGVVQRICNQLRVDFFACRGYNSQSNQWRAGRRMAGRVNKGQTPIVFHLGDHDPSGLDMTRDNAERLSMFAGVPISVVRLGLNRDQIDELRPPPNPAKMTDSRFEEYRRQHGDQSWELDALDPAYISRLISNAVGKLRDEKLWDIEVRREAQDIQALKDAAEVFGGGQEPEGEE